MPVHTRNYSRLGVGPGLFTTPKRSVFWSRWKAVSSSQSFRAFIKASIDEDWCPSLRTALRWKKQIEEAEEARQQSPTRRVGPQKQIGRPRIDTEWAVETMARGPQDLRLHNYEWFQNQANCSYSTLRRRMNERKKPVIRSKRRWTTQISKKNKKLRIAYGYKYRWRDVDSLWQHIHWTDEAHIDRAIAINQFIFREHGNHDGLLAEKPQAEHLVLHIAASVSWHHKSDLYFYNDEEWTNAHLYEIWKKAKPRRNGRNQSEEVFQSRLDEWKASQPPETVKKGNAMTQSYYARKILPKHLGWIDWSKNRGYEGILMEDGDPSHGHRSSDNPSVNLRRWRLVHLHDHPPQSPDLNPIEGIWLLLQERLKQWYGDRLYQMDYFALRDALKAVWDSITIEEIRTRIRDMTWRCRQLVWTGGKRVKGVVW